jgi:bis(5'-nucleosyl)-tetraphosphatase (symmetrical)
MRSTIWAIGDVQGCLGSFLDLLGRLPADAHLWLTGDLVNRGPESLETLRWMHAHQDRITTVLGNHDLHLLAIAAGARKPHRGDTFDEILSAPDRDELLDWLRQQPLAHFESGWLMVHAGVLPQWSAELAVRLAEEASAVIAGPHWKAFMHQMYGNRPTRWDPALTGTDRLRLIVNALTRLRFCSADGDMEFDTKEGLDGAPDGYLPWFDCPGRHSADTPIVFGHWSSLGLILRPDLMAIDTGCVWGRQLTAVRLLDQSCIQVACEAITPGA